jgi:hypothetical protein
VSGGRGSDARGAFGEAAALADADEMTQEQEDAYANACVVACGQAEVSTAVEEDVDAIAADVFSESREEDAIEFEYLEMAGQPPWLERAAVEPDGASPAVYSCWS